MFGRIILGLVVLILGGGMIFYSARLVEIFGRSRWADEKLGGTRQMWVLFGLGLFIVGGLVMLGIVSLSNPADVSSTKF